MQRNTISIKRQITSYYVWGDILIIGKRQLFKIAILFILAITIILYIFNFNWTTVFSFTDNKTLANYMIYQSIPQFYEMNNGEITKLAISVMGLDFNSPSAIINTVIPTLSFYVPTDKEEEPKEDMTNAKSIKETTIKNSNVNVKNATTYTLDIDQMLSEPLWFKFDGKEPEILIIHSHSSESYSATDKNYYLPTDPDRTEDIKYNVVRVGAEIVNTLQETGIKALHDTSLHDYPSYNGSYKSALASVNQYTTKYPSIKVILDIHRDAMVQADGTKLKLVSDVNGKKVAQIMLLTGTNQGGLEHPFWRENLKFAIRLQQIINKKYPTLARPVSLTKERYNTHTSFGSIIIEVGTSGNTLEEAIESAKLIGECIAEFVKSNTT